MAQRRSAQRQSRLHGPSYFYPHNGATRRWWPGSSSRPQFPSSYQEASSSPITRKTGSRLTFDASGNVTGVFNFEPADGSVDGPYGDIVYLTEGPDGALYYVDLGYSDISGTFGVSKIRRIEFIQSDLPPVAMASASPTQGPTPLTVNFSSSGSSDPEGQPLSYSWNFGDGTTSTQANPSHAYTVAGPYQVRLTVSDGVNSTLSTPIAISAGNRPVVTISSPTDGAIFRAGDVIAFSGTATDIEDGALPASAYTWNIDFLHEGHVHPGTPIVGVTSGTFTIPTSGHDFSGFTRYRIMLTVTDSSGLQSSQFVTIFPDKVNLTFDTMPAGVTLYLDGIAHTTPFTYDTLIGFHHEIEARNATVGTTTYNFFSWSDGGTQDHVIVVPAGGAAYSATYNAVTQQAPLAFVQENAATPQTNQTQVSVAYAGAQAVGYEHPGDRMGQRHVQHHVHHRLRRQRVSACLPDCACQWHKPGDLLRQEHQGFRRRGQHGDGDLRQSDAVRGCSGLGIQRTRSRQTTRYQRVGIGNQHSANSGAVTTSAPTNSSSGPERRQAASQAQAQASPLASSLRPT